MDPQGTLSPLIPQQTEEENRMILERLERMSASLLELQQKCNRALDEKKTAALTAELLGQLEKGI